MRHTYARVLTVVAFAGLLSSPALTTRLSADQGILALDAKYKGLTYGEWLAIAWQEVLAISVDKGSHPLINGGAARLNNGMTSLWPPVVPAGSPSVTIPVTIPSGQYLSVGMISVECSVAEAPPFHGEDEAELRACANGLLDLVSDVYAEIDGTPVADPDTYRAESPLFRFGPLAGRNYLGLRAGTQSDAVAAGYGLLLKPLGVGVHRITVRANVPDFGIAVDTTFIVNVERRPK